MGFLRGARPGLGKWCVESRVSETTTAESLTALGAIEQRRESARGEINDGLTVNEYEEYGPVEYFRDMFVSAWKNVLGIVKERRAKMD